MQYIALGLQRQNNLSIPIIIEIGKTYKYQIIIDDFKLDDEVSEGLKSFCSSVIVDTILYINSPAHKKVRLSSESISNDLSNYFMYQSECVFLMFIKKVSELIRQPFYLIFADEWKNEDKIRFIETDLDLLNNFFLLNNSWQLWLYDYKKSVYQSDNETPLIFLVKEK